jgi:hypothetical protein
MVPDGRRPAGKTAIRLRISLQHHTPAIWRRLVVPGDIKLSKLHAVLQDAMGWQDHHLHQFRIGDQAYGPSDDEFDDDEPEDIDEDSVRLSTVVRAPMRFDYHYDFGDDWQHGVEVESIESVPVVLKFAVCLDGERACPPEDCGGTAGFERLLTAVADPGHPEYDDYVRWMGRPFDPSEFSIAAVNAALQRLR